MRSCHVTASLIYNNLTTSSDSKYAAYAHVSEVILIDLVRAAAYMCRMPRVRVRMCVCVCVYVCVCVCVCVCTYIYMPRIRFRIYICPINVYVYAAYAHLSEVILVDLVR